MPTTPFGSGYTLSDIIADALPGTVAADLSVGPPFNPPSFEEYNALLVGALVSYIALTVLQRRDLPQLGSGRGGRVNVAGERSASQHLFQRSNLLAGGAVYWAMRLMGTQKTYSLVGALIGLYFMNKRNDALFGGNFWDGFQMPPLNRWLNHGRLTTGEVNFISRQPLPLAGSIN